MKRRGFLAALAAIPFVGRWIKVPAPGVASGAALVMLADRQDEWAREIARGWEASYERAFARLGVAPTSDAPDRS